MQGRAARTYCSRWGLRLSLDGGSPLPSLFLLGWPPPFPKFVSRGEEDGVEGRTGPGAASFSYRHVLDGVGDGVEGQVGQSRAQPVRGVQQVVVPPVVPAWVEPRKLVGQTPMRVEQPRLLALPLSWPSWVLGLRLGMEGIEAVGVVHVGVGVLRLGVDGLVRWGEVGGLEVGVGGVGERRGAGVGRLTHGPQLG